MNIFAKLTRISYCPEGSQTKLIDSHKKERESEADSFFDGVHGMSKIFLKKLKKKAGLHS